MYKITKNIWFKKIPNEWELCRLKYLISFVNGYAFESDDMALEGTYPVIRIGDIQNGEISYDFCLFVKDNKGLDKYQILKNDILIAMSGATVGKIGIAKETTESYINQRVGIIRCNNPKFLFYLLSTNEFMEYVYLNSPGSAQPNISEGQVAQFEVPIPPYTEQCLISSFLDKKCESINSTICKIEEQIIILKKYKVSLITEKILNPYNDALIGSKIDWIGKMSCNAAIIRLKDFSYLKGRIGWQGLTADEFIDEGPYCVTGTDFINGKINWDTCYHISEKRYEMDSNIHLKVGDLLVTKDGTIGKLAKVNELPDKACLNSHLLIIRPQKNKYINDYLYYVMSSDIFIKYYSLEGDGSTMNSLSQEKVGNFKFPVYSLEQQREIASYLDEKTCIIDETISKLHVQLDKLKKYKSSLIYEYVSGQKRVEVK